MDPNTVTRTKGNEITLSLNPDVIAGFGGAVVAWQKEKNEGRIKEIEAFRPLQSKEIYLKFGTIAAVLVIVLVLSIRNIVNAQFTVGILSAIVTYLFTVGFSKQPEERIKKVA